MAEQNINNLPVKLAAPAKRALLAAGVWQLDQLAQVSEAEVAKWHGIGPNALTLLRAALKARGLSFKNDKEAGQP